MKTIITKSTVHPDFPCRDFNSWQEYLHRERQKINRPYKGAKILKLRTA